MRISHPPLLLALVPLITMAACGPVRVDPIVEIGASATAFVIPLEGDTKNDQDKFESVSYFEERKVASKRITLPQRRRSTGRMWFDYEWVPTHRILIVQRNPVTMHWSGGTKEQAICVESLDSIGICVGVDLTVEVHEEDAATFLYNYGATYPDKVDYGITDLQRVANVNIRSMLITVLSREFGARDLKACRDDKGVITSVLKREVGDHFKTKGVTITNIGLVDGLTYENPHIQAAIDATFVAEQAALTAAQNEQAAIAQARVKVENAKGDAEAAEEFAKAQSAAQAKVRLEIERMQAEAALEMAKKWNGALPASILPANSPLIMSLGARE